MSYNLGNIPEGTTHVWTYALDQPWSMGIEILAFYKMGEVPSDTQVYSRFDGWRPARNPPEWFVTEQEAGFFDTIEEAVKKKLDKQL